jgi:hypothetical protein
MIRLLLAAAILALAGSAPSAAKDEAAAHQIVFDLALASWAGGACSAVMQVDQDAVLQWSRVIISDLDNNSAAAEAMVKATIDVVPTAAAGSLTELGWAEFCAGVWDGYGDGGVRRPGLLHKTP